ncbi:MAG: PfkB family carbohydrate kinase [Planctomycetota bacterium]
MMQPTDFFPDRKSLEQRLARFAHAKIAVVGDFFLDRYLVIDPALGERSVETGLTANQVVAIRNSPGAAGTVVNNLVALGAGELHAVGIIGDDAYGFELIRELKKRRVLTDALIRSEARFTPTYTKPMLREPGGERELERMDIINRTATPSDLEDRLLDHLAHLLPGIDAVILLDQVSMANCGVVTTRVREAVADLAEKHADKIFYADSRKLIGQFRHVIIKANHHEALRAVGAPDAEVPDETELAFIARQLMDRTKRPVVITMGPKGMLVTDAAGQARVPGFPPQGPVDIVGAGDSATAGMVLSLCSGASLAQASLVGNLVASLTVQQIGTTGTATQQQVLDRYDDVRS